MKFKFFYIAIVLVIFNSCRTEATYDVTDINVSSNNESKSMWKEDIMFINNSRSIFENNFNEERFYTLYGTPLWEFAMTMDNFDESYAVVPLEKKGKIGSLMKIIRRENKIFFMQEKTASNINFFDIYVNADRNNIIPSPKNNSITSKRMCAIREYTHSYLSDDGGVTFVKGSYQDCSDIEDYIYDGGLSVDGFNYGVGDFGDFGGGKGGGGSNGLEVLSPSFIMNKNDIQKYPKFTNTVKNIVNYVESNPKVLQTLQKYTNLTREELVNKLKFGSGPKIEITELNGAYGYHNPFTNTVQISKTYVQRLESSTHSNGEVMNLFLSIVLLHEFVHWTDGLFFNWTQENGENWEIATYGVVVDHLNVVKLIKK